MKSMSIEHDNVLIMIILSSRYVVAFHLDDLNSKKVFERFDKVSWISNKSIWNLSKPVYRKSLVLFQIQYWTLTQL